MIKRKKRLIILLSIFIVIIGLYIWGFSLKAVDYRIHSKKLPKGLKIVFISDLHNCFYGGTDQSELMDEISEAEPDLVIFGGDVIDQWGGTKFAERIMKWSASRYPTYYSPGNHEYERDDREEFFSKVKDLGVHAVINEFEDTEIKGQKIRIYGVPDAYKDAAFKKLKQNLDDSFYNILLAHQPEQIKQYLDTGKVKFDLILSGHSHGGQWRIPKILDQGLYSPDQGLFPEYTCGEYHYGNSTHIISRGLAKPARMIFIPRIFNRPEFSVIEIEK